MVKVHYSRILRFTGDDLPYWEAQAEQNWGASVVESIFDELKKRDNVSWNIAQLTFMASLRVLKMSDMGQMLSATDEQTKAELYRTIEAQNWLMSNMGLQLIDAADDLQSHQYTFGGVSDVYKQFMMDIAGAARIPATKLFGRSPEGMNATGESDLQNYYDMIAQEQEAKLRPILNKLLPVLCMSVFGSVPDDLDFEFDPVSEPSDEQRTDLAKNGTDIVVSALNAGLVSPRTALKEMKQQSERTGVWTNITDADIMKASDEIDAGGEMGGFGGMEPQEGMAQDSTKSVWNESEHPRDDDNGQFTKAGSGSTGYSEGYGNTSVVELQKRNNRRQFKVNGRRYAQLLLPKDEYARIMHAVDTNITPEQIDRGRFWKNIDNSIYDILIVNEDDKDYVIIGKELIL